MKITVLTLVGGSGLKCSGSQRHCPERAFSLLEYSMNFNALNTPTHRPGWSQCLTVMTGCSSPDLEYAASYIFRQGQTDARNPYEVSTGGTPFMHYSKKHRAETAELSLGPYASSGSDEVTSV